MRRWLLKLLVRILAPPVRIDKQLAKAHTRDGKKLGSVELNYAFYHRGYEVKAYYPNEQEHFDEFYYKEDFNTALNDFRLLQAHVEEI